MTTTDLRPPRAAVRSARPEPVPPGGRHRGAAPVPAPGHRPPWEIPGLVVMLLGTGLLYLWNLSASGWANSFYAAAVQAGTQSWTAFLFGSLDSANAITVDKPPASLWAMEISARIFGFSSWSILVPQALMGIGAVALLWATVRRVSGPGAGLLAGAVLALTPVATLMFRFDNPDALLVLLLVAAAYCTTRAIDGPPGGAGTRWLALAGFVIGFAFLTKMMQAFLILPALAAAYGLAAPTGLGRRIGQMAVAGVGIVVGSGWWLLTVALWPAAARPYIGGSTNNSAWELALGYNGLGRIFGGSGNGGGAGGGGGTMFGGSTGITRMFGSAFGTQISWLLPAALLLGAVAFWLLRRAPLAARSGRGQDPAGPATRTTTTDRTRAALVLWGGWTLVTALTFSFMSGTIHPYYAVALAPGIAGLVAVGGVTVWAARDTWLGRCTLALASAGTAVWAFVMLGWSDSGLSVIRWPVLVIGVLAGLALLVPLSRTRWAGIAVGVALVAGLVAPAAYSVQTALTAHTGSTPVAGPSAAGSTDGPGGGGDGGGSGGGTPPSSGDGASSTTATTTGTAATTATTDDAAQAGGPGGGGQGGEGEQTSAEVTTLLQNAGTTWAAATVGSQSAASLELADTDSDIAVMAIGGFSGTDTYPTLAQFQAYVADGQIHYFVGGEQGGGQGGPGGDSGVSSEITAWVQAHYAATTVGGQTIYDLTQPTS